MNEQAATLNHARDTLIDLAIRFGPRLLTALLILGVGVAGSRWVSRGLAGARSPGAGTADSVAADARRGGRLHGAVRDHVAAEPGRGAAAADRRAGRGGRRAGAGDPGRAQ